MDMAQMDDMDFIKTVLLCDYQLTADQAEDAIRIAKIRSFFETDPDMASHDSYQQWGEYAYKCWKAGQSGTTNKN